MKKTYSKSFAPKGGKSGRSSTKKPFVPRGDKPGRSSTYKSFESGGDKPEWPKKPFVPGGGKPGWSSDKKPFVSGGDKPGWIKKTSAPGVGKPGWPSAKKPFVPRGDKPEWSSSKKPFEPRGDKTGKTSSRKPWSGADKPGWIPSKKPFVPGGDKPEWSSSKKPFEPGGDKPEWSKKSFAPGGGKPSGSLAKKSFEPGGDKPKSPPKSSAPGGGNPSWSYPKKSFEIREDKPVWPKKSSAPGGDKPEMPSTRKPSWSGADKPGWISTKKSFKPWGDKPGRSSTGSRDGKWQKRDYNNSQEPDQPLTVWDQAARWYDSVVGEEGSYYQKEIILPKTSEMLKLKKGDRVLDLACGQGVFSRFLHSQGVNVEGMDLSAELIEFAQSRSDAKIKFHVGDSQSHTALAREKFDAIVCILAIQNIETLEPVFHNVARWLKPGGRFVMVMTHPCFRVPRQTHWGWDEEKKLEYRRVDLYATETAIPILTPPMAQSEFYTTTYHRPLQSYFTALSDAGLVVDGLEEWVSNKVSQPGSRSRGENRARKEIPLFLALSVVPFKGVNHG